jgi:dihydroorotate dehydrogenase
VDADDLRALVEVATACGVSGFIATNTTTARSGLSSPAALVAEAGGLSGRPLRDRSTAVIQQIYELSGGRFPVIGVGGIFDAADAYAKVRAGASLLQLYTGFVYQGPGLALAVRDGLRNLLVRDGYSCVADAVGGRRAASRLEGAGPSAP